MTRFAEVELQRERWRRALERLALDTDDRPDFARRGLASRLRVATVQLLLLPSDPEAAPVTIDGDLAARYQGRQSIGLGDLNVALPFNPRRTAHALAVVDHYETDWNYYYALHRSGAVEFGLGDVGGWEGADSSGDLPRMIFLSPTVARVWALLALASEAYEHSEVSGPYQLTIAVPNVRGALLGRLSEGWSEPHDWNNRVGPCLDANLLWHLEIDELPDADRARAIAFSVGDRIEEAWGSQQQRYLAHRGDHAGQLDPRTIN